MSALRHILVCDSLAHAQLVDALAMDFLRDMGYIGAEWSGILVLPGDPADTYGILWESPIVGLYGPAEDPDTGEQLLPVVEEVITLDAEGIEQSNWVRLPAPEPEVTP